MTYVARSTQIAARMLGGEMVIMSGVDSRLFTLNEVATAIWNGADGRTTLEQIVDERVLPEFEVERETALQDAHELVRELAQQGILIVSEQPIEQ